MSVLSQKLQEVIIPLTPGCQIIPHPPIQKKSRILRAVPQIRTHHPGVRISYP